MCLFIFVWLSSNPDMDELEPIYKKHEKEFKGPIGEMDVPELGMNFWKYDPGPSRHCDCDSSLGIWGVNLFEKLGYPLKVRMRLSWRKLKAKFKETDNEDLTLESVLGIPSDPADREHRPLKEDNDLQLWMDLLNETVGSGSADGIGLSLSWGGLDDVESVECLTMEDVTEDFLAKMRLDTLYIFSKKNPTSS